MSRVRRVRHNRRGDSLDYPEGSMPPVTRMGQAAAEQPPQAAGVLNQEEGVAGVSGGRGGE
eukprot:COSAG02_NODE_65845_length_257_cov_0.632911_1_plen_60_part_10